MLKPWKMGLGATLALACAPSTQGPTQVAALVQNNTGAFVTKPVTLKTIRDVIGLQGDAANLIGGARIVIDGNDPNLQAAQTDQQVLDAILKDKGSPPTAQYVTQDGALWPADFHTWNMVSTYYNFERAFDYWQQVPQVPSSELAGPPVYYWASFTQPGDTGPETDNALWYSIVQGFALLPFQQLQQVPFPMNPSVIAHEYSHRIFNQRVYGGASLPAPLINWAGLTADPGANVLKSIDEGLADYHAVGTSCLSDFGCDPRFLRYSLPDDLVSPRDMSTSDKCLTPALRDAIEGMSLNEFLAPALNYQVGTVFASALYHAGESTGKREVLEKAVVDAYQDANPSAPGLKEQIDAAVVANDPSLFSMGVVADSILAHVTDPELATALCSEFLTRLQLDQNETDPRTLQPVLAHCPSASFDNGTCPAISPKLP